MPQRPPDPSPRRTPRAKPLGWLVAGVVLAHGVVVSSVVALSHAQPRIAASARVVQVVQVTHVTHMPPRPAVTRPSLDASPAQQADATHTPPTTPTTPQPDTPPDFWPAEQLDRRALPVAAPDVAALNGITLSGLSLRLRLFIDARGQVVDVQARQITSFDESALPQLRAMFMATAFVPGRLHGRDVPSFTDLELGIERIDRVDGGTVTVSQAETHAQAPATTPE